MELFPASAITQDGIRTMVESHVLERNKYWNKYPTVDMKKEDPENANKMLILFSDVALEGSLRKIEYVEYRVRNKLHIIRCFIDKMVLVGISSDNVTVDFTNSDILQKSIDNPSDGIKVYTSEKKYEVNREMDIFKMTQSGFLISDGNLYKKLCLFL